MVWTRPFHRREGTNLSLRTAVSLADFAGAGAKSIPGPLPFLACEWRACAAGCSGHQSVPFPRDAEPGSFDPLENEEDGIASATIETHVQDRLRWRPTDDLPPGQSELVDGIIELLDDPRLSPSQAAQLERAFFGTHYST